MGVFPELAGLGPILESSRRGLRFPAETARLVAPVMEELMTAQGARRIELFMLILGALSRAQATAEA